MFDGHCHMAEMSKWCVFRQLCCRKYSWGFVIFVYSGSFLHGTYAAESLVEVSWFLFTVRKRRKKEKTIVIIFFFSFLNSINCWSNVGSWIDNFTFVVYVVVQVRPYWSIFILGEPEFNFKHCFWRTYFKNQVWSQQKFNSDWLWIRYLHCSDYLPSSIRESDPSW